MCKLFISNRNFTCPQAMTKASNQADRVRRTRSQGLEMSPLRHVTRALTKTSPTSSLHSGTPCEIPQKKVIGSTKKKATTSKVQNVSPLRARLHSIRNE